jgi:hypothetical protein
MVSEGGIAAAAIGMEVVEVMGTRGMGTMGAGGADMVITTASMEEAFVVAGLPFGTVNIGSGFGLVTK